MKKFIKVFFAVAIFSLSIWKLSSELSSINMGDVFRIIEDRSISSIVTLILVSFIGIWILSLYDLVLVRSQKLVVPIKKTMIISWIINSLNTLIGFGGIIGGTIRYNYFKDYTETNEQKTTLKKNISLLILSMITGIGVLSILVLFGVFSSNDFLKNQPILKIVLISLAILLPIFLVATFVKPAVTGERFLGLKYTCVSVLDYLFAGIIMFLSLHFVDIKIDFWQMESVFIIAVIAGLISMVPGGFGAFDVIFLLGMTTQFPLDKEAVLLALVFYRFTYYILPFILGLFLAINELQLFIRDKKNKQEEWVLFTKEFGTIFVDITKRRVQVLIKLVLVVLFAFGTLFFIQDSFFGVITASPFESNQIIYIFASIYLLSSIYMIPNYVGLYYGSKRAFKNLLILLIIILLSQIILFQQLALIEGFIFTIGLLLILYFSRKSFSVHLTVRYKKSVAVWLLTALILFFDVIFVYSTSAYYEITVYDYFVTYLGVFSLIWFIYLIADSFYLRKKYKFRLLLNENNMSNSLDDYEEMLHKFGGNNLANLGFLPNNHLMIDNELEVGCIYQENKYFILVLGDPLGNKRNFFPFINKINDFAATVGKEMVFYQATTEYIHIYTEFNYNLFNLGEEAEVDVTAFKITGNKGKPFRQLLNKQKNDELTFQIEAPSKELLSELRVISEEWLGTKKEMSFSLGNFDEFYLSKQDIATIRDKKGHTIAFASMMPTYVDGKISVDLIRWKENEHIPMMDLLYLNLILWAKENDYQIFNLGMAPLSSSFEKTNDLIGTITTSIYQHSSYLYSFKGLRNYKNKFKPHWYSRYLVYPKHLSISQAFLQSYKIIHPK